LKLTNWVDYKISMQRKRINKSAFEGLLWLQQQDAARAAQQPKPKRDKLTVPEGTGVAVPSIFQAAAGVAIPGHLTKTERSNSRFSAQSRLAGQNLKTRGISSTFSSLGSLTIAADYIPHGGCLHISKQSFYGPDFYEREIGRLMRVCDASAEEIAAAGQISNPPEILTLFTRLPKQERDMSDYIKQAYGARSGYQFSTKLAEPVILLRPEKYKLA
jgi:hypothetical protein